MPHCTTSVIQDNLSELFLENEATIKHIHCLMEKVEDTARSLADLKLAARSVIEYYEKERKKNPSLDRALKQLESLMN